MQIVIVSVLGVVTTISIAWTAAVYVTDFHAHLDHGNLSAHSLNIWFEIRTTTLLTEVYWFAQSADCLYYGMDDADKLPTWSRALEASSLQTLPSGPLHQWRDIAYGWPMRSMIAMLRVTINDSPTHGIELQYVADSGISLDSMHVGNQAALALHVQALPLRILPLGFAIDTLLFASAWWLFLFAFPTTRRFIRTRRGMCLACGYGPLGGASERCPECGAPRSRAPSSAARS